MEAQQNLKPKETIYCCISFLLLTWTKNNVEAATTLKERNVWIGIRFFKRIISKCWLKLWLKCFFSVSYCWKHTVLKWTTTKTFAGISLPFCYSTTPARWTRSMITKSASPLRDTPSSHKIYHNQQRMSPYY